MTSRAASERGTALILALLTTMLLTALGMALVLASRVETAIAANYANGQDALYAADAVVERALRDLAAVPQWDAVLGAGAVPECARTMSSFAAADCSSAAALTRVVPGTSQIVDLRAITDALQADIDNQNDWGANNPTWRVFAFGGMDDMLPGRIVDSHVFVALWISDDPAETDGDAAHDANGVVTLHAEAFGPSGARRIIEATVARAPSSSGVRIVSWREIR